MKKIFKFLKVVLFSKHVSLEDNDKYDIEYLYNLLIKNDYDTQLIFFSHMHIIRRSIYILATILMNISIIDLLFLKTMELRISVFCISFSLFAARLAINNHREHIKNLIELRKYVEDKKVKIEDKKEKLAN